ncbi:MAG: TRAP transporter small permease [Aminobacteriaceae bacterium]|jgi:TRAP-type C4-dicarboxylate transport system permease small subunit
MKRLLDIGISLYRATLTLMTVALFIIVGVSVFTRYCLNSSLGWSDELSRFLFIWVTFLGAAYAYGLNEHIGLDFVVDRVRSEKTRTVIRLLGEICIGVVIFVIAWYGWDVAASATNLSPALDIPMTFVYGVVPLTGALMLIQNILKILQWIGRLRTLSAAPERR